MAPTDPPPTTPCVGRLNEKPLHAALKAWYSRPGDVLEAVVDGYVIDIVRGDHLVEIQTRGFAALKAKLHRLVDHHPLRLVYPISAEKWIVRAATEFDQPARRRKSPKRGLIVDVFEELVSFPRLLAHPNFTLEVVRIREEEVRRQCIGRNWRRRGWGTVERHLLDVLDARVLAEPADLATLLPTSLAEPFGTADLAAALHRPRRLAQRMAYCLRHVDVIVEAGKDGNAVLYVRA